MKKSLCSLFLFSLVFNLQAQMMFLQKNFKGGVSADGVSYYNFDYLQADTIQFQNSVPSGSPIKKAFLFTMRAIYDYSKTPQKDVNLQVNLNNNLLVFDSSSIISTPFYSGITNNVRSVMWINALDVTNKVLSNNNKLIIPCQACMIAQDTSRNYIFDSYYLLILYENNLMPSTNLVIFVNNKTYQNPMNYSFSELNPINTSNDVGLALWTNFVCTQPSQQDMTSDYTINSTFGSFYLGKLDMHLGNYVFKKTLPGSFFYQNNTFSGLVDDTPDLTVDSTDAIANIKTLIPPNSNSFDLTSNGNARFGLANARLGFVLAYSTPCPARGFTDTLTTYTICEGQSVMLGAQSSGNTFTWYPKVNLNDSTIFNPVASPTTTTNYFVLVDSLGCKHTEQVRVNVTPAPKTYNITSTNNICGGLAGSVTVTPPTGIYSPYTYSLNGGTYQSNDNFSSLGQGTYFITIKDNLGCTWQSNSVSVQDVNPVSTNFSIQTATNNNVAPLYVYFINSTSGANNYTWYFPTNTANTYNANYTFSDSGTYTITLIAYNSLPQCADTISKTITVLPQDTAGIFIPNVFSPNNDGINDVFEMKTKNAELELFEIYDRWGVLVSSALDLTKNTALGINYFSWSGRTTSGMECTDGTYFYVVKIKFDEKYSKEGTKEYKGFITLIR